MPLRTLIQRIAIVLWIGTVLFVPSFAGGQPINKLDPFLKQVAALRDVDRAPLLKPLLKGSGTSAKIDLFIRTIDGSSNFRTSDVVVKSASGDIVIATVPIARLEELAGEAHVVSLHAAKIWTPTLDKSVSETRADSVRSPYDVTGAGILVGVIDTGIDWRHRDFRHAADTTRTRIKFLWDMSDTLGPPPSGSFASSGGTEWTETQINQGIAGALSVRAKDQVGHGTHVAGIAAGLQGMASGANLIIVKATRIDAPLSFQSTDVVNALNYIDARAASLSRPWVTNLSLGGQQGPHDGRSAEDSAIDNLVGSGNPRKVVVVAAGNDGERRLHSSGTLNANSAVSVSKSFTVTTAGSVVGIDLWTQISPNIPTLLSTRVTGPDTLFEVSGSGGSANHTDGDISIFSSPFSNTDVNTSVTITIKKTGTWTISLKGARGSGTGNFDMWIYSGNASWTPPDGDFSRLVGTPGSAKNAITVGAYVSKASWIDQNNAGHTATANGVAVVPGNVASFTSPGPTRDGRQKPEISAPGQVIASSFSSDATPGNGLSIFGTGSILVGGKQAIAQGTSMAAPHVVGAVALVLEEAAKRASNLDAIQIRSLMQATARADAATGTVPNAQWGSGKMNVDSLFFVIFGDPLPNAITLTSFAAETDGRRVALAWHISNPSNHAGFHVYRATTAYPEDRIRITPALIIGGPHLSYDDTPPTPGTYHYWLADVDITGHSTFHGPVTMVFTGLPAVFRLGQSRPNPFNPSTLIEYDLPRQTHVSLTVYNILGQEVARLVDGVRQAGRHTVTWNGRNAQGQPASSGVYLYRLTDIAGFVESRRMLLLK